MVIVVLSVFASGVNQVKALFPFFLIYETFETVSEEEYIWSKKVNQKTDFLLSVTGVDHSHC